MTTYAFLGVEDEVVEVRVTENRFAPGAGDNPPKNLLPGVVPDKGWFKTVDAERDCDAPLL